LDNLAKSRNLDAVPDSPGLALAKLASARKRMADAGIANVSRETRFDAAYNAIRDLAEIGLLIYGYRTNSRGGGHHQLAIQCLKHTLGVDDGRIQVIDSLRKQRHLADYDGDTVTAAALSECVRQGTQLLPEVEKAMNSKGWV
jgi:hypothetical protein